MRSISRRFAILVLLLCAGCSGKRQAEPDVTFATCLDDLTNIAGICEMRPQRGGMSSSYDRAGGNADSRNFVRTADDGSYVLADLKGPGCVRRLWFTSIPGDEEIRFSFDGEKSPRLVIKIEELREAVRFPFVSPLCESPSGATCSYAPIPYEKSLLITTGPNEKGKFYYHINYDSFPDDTVVSSFNSSIAAGEKQRLHRVGAAWNSLSETYAVLGRRAADAAPGQLAADSTAVILDVSGPGILEDFCLQITPPEGIGVVAQNRLLRQIVLKCYWDNSSQPSVEVPLGDFFCNALRPREFVSLPLAYDGKTYACRFPMPFAKQARIEVSNDSKHQLQLATSWNMRKLPSWRDDLTYFHAGWRQSTASGIPHTIMRAIGKGHYVGCYLIAIATDGQWNILEGDERMFIDGERTPSMHGTGLEDYFNGGWYYSMGSFDTPLAGALESSGIRTTQYRFHMADTVSFDSSLLVNIEFGHGNMSRGYMSSVAYWYQETPGASLGALPAPGRRYPPRDPFEARAMMCEVLDRERAGHLAEARHVSLEYAEKFKGSPQAELMELRAIAYGEAIEGYAQVKDELQSFKEQSQHAGTKQQAALLQQFHHSDSNGLLFAHVNARYAIYLDGKPVLTGDDPISLNAAPVILAKGDHTLAAEVVWTRPDNWVTIHLRMHSGDVWTDGSWKRSREAAGNWRSNDYDDSGWETMARNRGTLPKMQFLHFEPNAFVNVQYHELKGAPAGWDTVGQRTYFRKVFTVE